MKLNLEPIFKPLSHLFCAIGFFGVISIATSANAQSPNSCSPSDLSDLAKANNRRPPVETREVRSQDRLLIKPESVKLKNSLLPKSLQLPPSIRLLEAETLDGQRIQLLERMVKTQAGFRRDLTELPMDPVTGALDGSLESVREFASLVAQTRNGKWAAHVVDVNNLGYINRNFTFGLTPSDPSTPAEVRAVTDAYLRSIAQALEKAAGEGALVIRTGGDEFLILQPFDRTAQVSQVQRSLNSSVRAPDGPKWILREETVARARRRRQSGASLSEAEAEAYRLEYSPHSQPSVSIGTSIVHGEDLFTEAVPAADRLMTEHKELIKTRDNAPNSPKRPSYQQNLRGSPRFNQTIDPLAPRNTAQRAPTNEASSHREAVIAAPDLPSLRTSLNSNNEATYTRVRELSRFGPTTVVEYRDYKERVRYFAETYSNGTLISSRELHKDAVTGVVSARQLQAQALLGEFFDSTPTQERGFVWFNIEHLGTINSFDDLKASGGDLALAEFSKTAQETVPQNTFIVKRGGSEFAMAIEGLNQSELLLLQDQLASRFRSSSAIQRLWSNQIRALENLMKDAEAAGDPEKARALKDQIADLEKKRQRLITVHGTLIRPNDDRSSVRARTRALRYPDDSSYSLDGL